MPITPGTSSDYQTFTTLEEDILQLTAAQGGVKRVYIKSSNANTVKVKVRRDGVTAVGYLDIGEEKPVTALLAQPQGMRGLWISAESGTVSVKWWTES